MTVARVQTSPLPVRVAGVPVVPEFLARAVLRSCAVQDKWWLLSEMGPLAAVPAAFAAFVVWNGGIVVGDRSNHAPKLHLVQPLYFLLFAAAALAQIHFHPARWASNSEYKYPPAAWNMVMISF